MKTKVILLKTAVFALLIVCSVSCKKNNPVKADTSISLLSGSWNVNKWGNITNNRLVFNVDVNTKVGTVTQLGSQPLGYAVGDIFLSAIVYNASGRYNAASKYTFGPNNNSSSTREAILTLQNNNTQLTIDYPALNTSFPEITYIFQKN